MRVLAIDASSKSTGIAIFENNKLIKYECISASNPDFIKRIEKMTSRIRQLFDEYQPTDVVMEQILPDEVSHNQKTYKILCYLQAAIVMQLHKSGMFIDLVVSSHWRKLCGIQTGSTKRQQLKEASIKLIKQLYNIDVNDDVSDAICLGIAYILEHKKNAVK